MSGAVLEPGQRATLAAAMAQIIPSGDDGPGAAEADAAGYADWAMRQPAFQPALRGFAAGLALLDGVAEGLCGAPFARCEPHQQRAALERLQGTPHPAAQRFFANLVFLSVNGFLCDPRYGGNRGGAGWTSVGFTPHPRTWLPAGEGAAE